MKLYLHPASPNCVTVLMTAIHSGIALETEFVDLMQGANREPGYLALNPNGRVPTLMDGEFALWESSAIMQYIAAMKPGNPLWPNDERVRADIARWQFWAVCHWAPALQPFVWENLFKRLKGMGGPDAAALVRAEENFHRWAAVLDGHLAARDHLVGEALTLADISAAAYLMYAKPACVPLQDCPEIRRWFASIEALPAWQRALPDPRVMEKLASGDEETRAPAA
jgi:glutathione S-transferase